MEDKRPIVESTLQSGRQYIASEPPVSDTSDTEGKYQNINTMNKLSKKYIQTLIKETRKLVKYSEEECAKEIT